MRSERERRPFHYRSLSDLDAPVVLARLLSLHLASWIRSQAADIAQQGGELARGREVAVCFADLVGFTRLGEEIPADELAQVVELLVVTTTEVVGHSVRLVKALGDAAMLVSPDTDALVDAALDLVAAVAGRVDEMPALRAGIALGTAVTAGGDWYGPPVNLTSRITTAARPGLIVV